MLRGMRMENIKAIHNEDVQCTCAEGAVQYLANVVNFNGEESISLAVFCVYVRCTYKLGYYITRQRISVFCMFLRILLLFSGRLFSSQKIQ